MRNKRWKRVEQLLSSTKKHNGFTLLVMVGLKENAKGRQVGFQLLISKHDNMFLQPKSSTSFNCLSIHVTKEKRWITFVINLKLFGFFLLYLFLIFFIQYNSM
ncbi:hypothetical protein L6452_19279 [Arctium lappa]|uniref:Uncharacterized protein n=1 Tax=Arctium lappa TaxID=4217 RepID=A0ACB9B7E5_ARCLA|nr:hypothetical protein L6452_19279 [Arctium lappa]